MSNRPLTGRTVAISISAPHDTLSRGFPDSEINRTTLRIASALLGQGAQIAFGHDWRDDGVMEAVHSFAQQYRASDIGVTDISPSILNLVPWPQRSRIAPTELSRLRTAILVEEVRPSTIAPNAVVTPELEAESLRHMRIILTERSDARICVGGKITEFKGALPGIVEEALLSIAAKKPLYLLGIFGGAADTVISALRGQSIKDEIRFEEETRLVSRMRPELSHSISRFTLHDALKRIGIGGLSTQNGLSIEENERLFETQTVDEALDLILTGLRRTFGR